MIGLTIYIIGVVVALVQLLFLTSYFDRKGESTEQLSAATFICIGSWCTALMLILAYKEQFIEMFKRNDNTKI